MKLNVRVLVFVSILILWNTSIFAAADFYGVKMMSEYYAKDLVVDESQAAPRFSVQKPGMDDRIYAYATLSGRRLKIDIFNRSNETIQSDYDYAEYTVVTHDGERITLSPQPMAWASNNAIPPNKSVSFAPSFQGRVFKKDEIRAIICSFELGDQKIILLPLTKKSATRVNVPAKVEPVKKTEPAPAKTAETVKSTPKKAEEKKSSFLGNLFAPKKETKSATSAKADPSSGGKKIKETKPAEIKKQAPKKIEEKKLPEKKSEAKSNFASKKTGAAKPKAEPKKETPALSIPEPKKIEEKKPVEIKRPAPKKAEEKKVAPKKATLSPENEKKLLDQYARSGKPRKYWLIEEVTADGLIVINLGAADGLKPGASIQIARDGAFLAQGTIRQLSQGYATASVTPESAVKAGDDVLFFGATA